MNLSEVAPTDAFWLEPSTVTLVVVEAIALELSWATGLERVGFFPYC